MIKVYDGNKINDTILDQMYKILIENLFITYPSFLDNRDKHDNEKNYNIWTNMIKTTENYNVIIYKENNKVFGFLNYCIIDSNLWISEVQIKDEYKNKRILKKLINKFVLIEKNRKYSTVTIHINDENILSKTVFEHIGFKSVGDTLYKINIKDLIDWSIC
ncbi:MAG: GNAT family N-acetyltransferase [Bacilli bacterium]|nr:GNAT family N-acetyltransferase [Bacilli bacterium]